VPFAAVVGMSNSGSFLDTGLSSNTTYYYRIVAVDAVGHLSDQSATASATTAPLVPTGVQATLTAQNTIQVRWNAVAGAVRYDVYRASSFSGQGTKIGTVMAPSTSFVDPVPAGSTFWYRVSASNNGGESARSLAASATTIPAAPTNANWGPPPATGRITLVWTASAGATQYQIHQQHPGSTQWNQIGSVNAPTTSFTMDVGPNNVEWYSVTASNSAGTSPRSNVAVSTISIGP
jgi:fibronectin type 3 domain-containing protein